MVLLRRATINVHCIVANLNSPLKLYILYARFQGPRANHVYIIWLRSRVKDLFLQTSFSSCLFKIDVYRIPPTFRRLSDQDHCSARKIITRHPAVLNLTVYLIESTLKISSTIITSPTKNDC